MVEPDRVQPDSGKVMIVAERVHGVVGGIDDAVIVAVAFLHARLEHSYNRKAHAIDSYFLTDGLHTGKKFVFCFGADHNTMGVTEIVGFVEETAFVDAERPNILERGIHSKHLHVKSTRTILDQTLKFSRAGAMLCQSHHVTNQLNVVVGEANRHASLVSAGLLRSPARINSHSGRAERIPDVADRAPEAFAISQ